MYSNESCYFIVSSLYEPNILQLERYQDEVIITGESFNEGEEDTFVNYKLVDVLEVTEYISSMLVRENHYAHVKPMESNSKEEENQYSLKLYGFSDLDTYLSSGENMFSNVFIQDGYQYNARDLKKQEMPSILLDKTFMENKGYQLWRCD